MKKTGRGDKNSILYILLEVLFFVLLLLFIILISSAGKTAVIDLSKTADQLLSEMDAEKLQKENALKIRSRFGLSEGDYLEAVYYGPVSNMDVEELLLLSLPEGFDKTLVDDAFSGRLSQQKQSFDGYGTNQMEILQHARTEIRGNYALFLVSGNAEDVYERYLRILKGGD